MVKKLITFTSRMVEMIEEIQEAKGYMSFSAVVHAAIVEMYTKTFPAYNRPFSGETGTDRVKRKDEEKKAKEDIVREELLAIADELGGELITENGKEVVRYFTYSKKKRYAQEVSLALLSQDLLKTQYAPDKATVLRLQKEGKVDYEV